MSDYRFAIVFVHLGPELPETLLAFSKLVTRQQERVLCVLITDNPRTSSKFEGEIIIVTKRSRASNMMLKKRPYYSKLALGYWLNTFERIFSLRELKQLPMILSLPVIHIESDVFPLMDSSDVLFLCNNFSTVSIPRFSDELGIGSFVFTPSLVELTSVLDELEELAIQNIEWLENDMQLLGLALNTGLMLELPSHPSDYKRKQYRLKTDYRVIFDGAALGQYLFGQDPFHQSGLRYSGFKNPSYAQRTDLDSVRWYQKSLNGVSSLMMEVENTYYKIANLHIHSKEVLPPLSENSDRWKRAIEEANRLTPRIQIPAGEVSPHSKKPSIWIRMRIARDKGIRVSTMNYLKRHLKFWVQK